jgi:hypothetical protein
VTPPSRPRRRWRSCPGAPTGEPRDTAAPAAAQGRVPDRPDQHAAEKGWQDLLAAARNAAVDAWEQLTAAPEERSNRQYPLKASLATSINAGKTYVRWQYKPTDGGRILVHEVSPGHPKKSERVTGRRR